MVLKRFSLSRYEHLLRLRPRPLLVRLRRLSVSLVVGSLRVARRRLLGLVERRPVERCSLGRQGLCGVYGGLGCWEGIFPSQPIVLWRYRHRFTRRRLCAAQTLRKVGVELCAGHTLLLHGVAFAHGDRVVFE